MSLPLGVLFESILHIDLPAREVLAIHLRNCKIRRFEVIVAHKPIALTDTLFHIAGDLGTNDETEVAKRFVEHLLVNF